MTKAEKLREIIRRDVKTGFMHSLEKQLNQFSPYVKKLRAHPDFIPAVIDEFVEMQLPFYLTVSDEAADKAYDFFMSPSGAEWCMLSAKFVIELNRLIPGFTADLVRRLENLN